jgi:glutamate racemase
MARLVTRRRPGWVVHDGALSRIRWVVMRVALINSGLGLLGAAAALRRLRPAADLVLSMDPDGMPWGPRRPSEIATRSLACARAAAAYRPDVLVFACNTGSVHALGVLRERFEPALPVVGTVPAIKPAAAAGEPVAIWATAATTRSAYQHGLIAEFAAGVPVAEVACPGLADAIHAGDGPAIDAAIADAAARTPPGTRSIVLGCTEYELAASRIAAALPGTVTFGSATAVAAQALRRARADAAGADGASVELAAAEPGAAGDGDGGAALGQVQVLLSGRPGELPAAALHYPEGRLLAGLPAFEAGSPSG